MSRRSFGYIRTLHSGRFQASYTGPDVLRHKAGRTFPTKMDAQGWNASERRMIDLETWLPPNARDAQEQAEELTVGAWVKQWLAKRKHDLRASTYQNYERTLDRRVFQVKGRAAGLQEIQLAKLARRDVWEWWDAITEDFDTPGQNRRAYKILRTAMVAAVERELLSDNPVVLRSAQPAGRRPLTPVSCPPRRS